MLMLPSGPQRCASSSSRARYPTPHSKVPGIRKKRSNFDFLTSARMLGPRLSHADRNKLVYRKAEHVDITAVKEHREEVRRYLERNITLLPKDVVMTAFLGKQNRKEPNTVWARTVRKTRLLHGLAKDRLFVHAFFTFLESEGWRQRLKGGYFTKREQRMLLSCRSSWFLTSDFTLPIRRYAKNPAHMQRHATSFWRFCLIHRNDPSIPMAWDHYKTVLPVDKSVIVEVHNEAKAQSLFASIATRRYEHTERTNALLQRFQEMFCATHLAQKPGQSDWKFNCMCQQERKRVRKALRRVPLLPHLQRLLQEQRVVAKMLLCFFETPEAKLFNSGVANYVQVSRLRHIVANGGMRPPRARYMEWFGEFKRLPTDARRPYYGIPPRSLLRPTNGFHLFVRHYHAHKTALRSRQAERCDPVEGKNDIEHRRASELREARGIWKAMTDTQKCSFEFPFPVSIAPMRPNRIPFHRFLLEESRLRAPPLSRHGKVPRWFFKECQSKWRSLPAAEKNRFDTDEEVRQLFPLVA